jgi:hypothetical protein
MVTQHSVLGMILWSPFHTLPLNFKTPCKFSLPMYVCISHVVALLQDFWLQLCLRSHFSHLCYTRRILRDLITLSPLYLDKVLGPLQPVVHWNSGTLLPRVKRSELQLTTHHLGQCRATYSCTRAVWQFPNAARAGDQYLKAEVLFLKVNLFGTQVLFLKVNLFGTQRGGAVCWSTALQAGRSRVRFPIVSLDFFIEIILPTALWPWGRLSLWQKWVPGIIASR